MTTASRMKPPHLSYSAGLGLKASVSPGGTGLEASGERGSPAWRKASPVLQVPWRAQVIPEL